MCNMSVSAIIWSGSGEKGAASFTIFIAASSSSELPDERRIEIF